MLVNKQSSCLNYIPWECYQGKIAHDFLHVDNIYLFLQTTLQLWIFVLDF